MALAQDQLLELAEAVRSLPIHDRAPCLVAGLSSDLTVEAAARLPLGERNCRLLAAHQVLFGPTLDLSAECPVCSERIELIQPIEVLCRTEPRAVPVAYRAGGRRLTLRPLNDGDLAAAAQIGSSRAARHFLAARALGLEEDRDRNLLSDATVGAVASRLGQIDPLAELLFDLSCPQCNARWSLPLDVPDLLARELIDAAETLLDEIHDLASRYAWSQADILALSPSRRAAYVGRARR